MEWNSHNYITNDIFAVFPIIMFNIIILKELFYTKYFWLIWKWNLKNKFNFSLIWAILDEKHFYI